MNRAEKRRQKKLAGKAAKKMQSIQVAQSIVQSPQTQQNMSIEQAIELGLQHHNAGDLPKAEGIYQQILQVEANQPVALHLLGVIAHQMGKNDIAIDLIGKALDIKPDYAEAHNNLGLAFKELGKLDDAVASYLKATNINPDDANVHNNLGNTLQEQGKLDDAVASYYQALAIKPDYAEVHYNLGIALKVQGKMHDAVASYRKAIAIKSDYAEAHNNLGLAFKELGKLDDAVASYLKALAIKPDYAEAHNNLGNGFREQGKLDDAVASYYQTLAIKPDYAEAHNNLGITLQEQSKLDDAVASYYKALAIKSDYAAAHNNLGLAFKELGKLDDAVASYLKALAIKPDYADAHNNLGITLQEQGKLDDAVASYYQALAIKSDYAEVHNNLGITLQEQGKLDDAVESYYQALAIKSDYAEVHYNLGIALKVQGKMHDAVASYRKAIAIKPDYASAIYNLGDALQEQGKWDDAVESYCKALELRPDKDGWHIRKALTLPVIFSSSDEVQKTRLELMDRIKVMQSRTLSVVNPIEDIGLTNFDLAYHNKNNKNILENIARLHLSACPILAYEAGHCSPMYNRKKGRLRIGFLSSFLKNHTIGKLYKGIVEHFSKDQFEVVFFQPTGEMDEISEAIYHSVDKVVPLHNKLEQDRESIASEELDILFYPDIGMAPYTYFLSFSRLAPIQVVSWGHPDTTGIHNIDYFLSSELIELEDTSNQYTEQLVQLSLMPTFYYRPKPPSRAYCRADYNLPETGALYVCPQALFKLHPDFDSVIANLLRKDHKGFLVLINDNVGGQHKNLIMKRFQATFPDVSDRVIFVPRMDRNKYMGLTMLADAMLDVPSFSGGNSSLEAFAMSVPIVTWPGEFMRSRVTAGYYAQMELSELIASSSENYIELAYKLAHDGTFKNHMYAEIKENSHKLYERMEVVREMEVFFIEAHKSWQKGEILSNEVFREVLDIK